MRFRDLFPLSIVIFFLYGGVISLMEQSQNEFVTASVLERVLQVKCSGEWTTGNLAVIEKKLRHIRSSGHDIQKVHCDVSGISEINPAGMLLFIQTRRFFKQERISVKVLHAGSEFLKMFRLVRKYGHSERVFFDKKENILVGFFVAVGRDFYNFLDTCVLFLDFIGRVVTTFFNNLRHLSFPIREISALVKKNGVTALPIVALTTFLIGLVIAFQSALQLQKYGANIFIVEIISISIVRELSPIITSIVVAGRSGSAFTAQLGAMKITEEIDAMSVMGFESFRFLVIPRIISLVLALPLLIFFGDIIGIFGGLVVAKFQLGVTPASFVNRLREISLMKHFLAGLIKAPFFAAIIASVGCFRGFQVSRDTESIGKYTTMSVVNTIFLVIIIDAVFSLIFTEIGF